MKQLNAEEKEILEKLVVLNTRMQKLLGGKYDPKELQAILKEKHTIEDKLIAMGYEV